MNASRAKNAPTRRRLATASGLPPCVCQLFWAKHQLGNNESRVKPHNISTSRKPPTSNLTPSHQNVLLSPHFSHTVVPSPLPASHIPETTTTDRQKAKSVQTLTYDLGNLTNAVMELQKLAADHYGVTLEYPVTLGDKEEGAEDADAEGDKTQPVDAGGGEGGDAPTGNLRGAGADGGNPEGSGGGDGDGGDGDAVDTGGDHARRLFTREKGEPEGRTGPAAAAVAGDEPAALRGGSGGPRQLEGGPRREG